jgi:hypothetical protein
LPLWVAEILPRASMTADLPYLFEQPKLLTGRLDHWIERDEEWFVLTSPVDIDGVTIAGLQFRAVAMRNLPDEAVAMQLEYREPSPKSVTVVLSRVEWRPLKAHNNKGLGPADFQFRPMKGSHVHKFDLNWREAQRAMLRGVVKIAVALSVEPNDYLEFIEIVGKELTIDNIHSLAEPPWTPRLV